MLRASGSRTARLEAQLFVRALGTLAVGRLSHAPRDGDGRRAAQPDGARQRREEGRALGAQPQRRVVVLHLLVAVLAHHG